MHIYGTYFPELDMFADMCRPSISSESKCLLNWCMAKLQSFQNAPMISRKCGASSEDQACGICCSSLATTNVFTNPPLEMANRDPLSPGSPYIAFARRMCCEQCWNGYKNGWKTAPCLK